ncbi:MAG: hypothetical protein A3G94_07840 [Deltaproteobacteria bacterium RIFCSPLOWO2_12_FULL_60_16]|nr:MAG: hypothetical protein A3G94_07840 [Deltaproteobacteria bacterium RIFCSPLOWO2_12_FULL_60_16]
MAPDTPNSGHQAPDQEIERLAQEIGRLIQSVEPERREDLKELAYTLIREEIFERDGRVETGGRSAPGPFNPLGSGVLILILGAGLSFVFGPVGLALMLGGLIFIVWGAVITWVKG